MTAIAETKTEPRSTEGRFSFQLCTTCPVPLPHGYFHLSDGRRAGICYFNKAEAIKNLSIYVERGDIPASDQRAIEEDIILSSMPELEDHQGETVEPDDLGMILMQIMGIENSRPADPMPDGSYSINFHEADGDMPAHGHIFLTGDLKGGPPFYSKTESRRAVMLGVNLGYVGNADKEAMLKQIEESTLPE